MSDKKIADEATQDISGAAYTAIGLLLISFFLWLAWNHAAQPILPQLPHIGYWQTVGLYYILWEGSHLVGRCFGKTAI